jgi:hypothetical protein
VCADYSAVTRFIALLSTERYPSRLEPAVSAVHPDAANGGFYRISMGRSANFDEYSTDG